MQSQKEWKSFRELRSYQWINGFFFLEVMLAKFRKESHQMELNKLT